MSKNSIDKIIPVVTIDKKISKRNTDTALILLPEMTIVEELVEYLKYIINIPEERIDVIIKEYYDTIKNS